MNDGDLLFNDADLERWKRRELSYPWLDDRMDVLRARLQAQSQHLKKLLAGASPAVAARLNNRL